MTSSKFISLLLSAFVSISCMLPADAQETTPKALEDRSQILKDLLSAEPLKSREAINHIRMNKDLTWLKDLAPLLENPQGRSRQIVTMLVLGVFPEESLNFFTDAAKSSSLFSREAAMYGLSRTLQPGVAKGLIQGLRDSEESVRNAALRGMQLICRPNGSKLFTGLLNSEPQENLPTHPAFTDLQETLQSLQSYEPKKPWKGVWNDIATRSTIRSLQDTFLSEIEDETKKSILQRVFQSSSYWACKAAVSQPLVYDFSMVNVVAGSSKEIHIDATPEEIERTRFLGYDLDRAVHLRMAVDLWLEAPHLYTKDITIDGNEITIQLDLTGSPRLHAGVGLLNISYWESRVSNGFSAQVVFDCTSGKWLREKVTLENNTVAWIAECSDWISGEPALPGKITIEMQQGLVGARRYPLTFRAFFDRKGPLWHLKNATMHELITDDTGSTSLQLRALAELEMVADQKDPQPDHSGQGSNGKSPKE